MNITQILVQLFIIFSNQDKISMMKAYQNFMLLYSKKQFANTIYDSKIILQTKKELFAHIQSLIEQIIDELLGDDEVNRCEGQNRKFIYLEVKSLQSDKINSILIERLNLKQQHFGLPPNMTLLQLQKCYQQIYHAILDIFVKKQKTIYN